MSLSKANIIESIIVVNGSSVLLEKFKINDQEGIESAVILYTANLKNASYYESLDLFIHSNLYKYPVETLLHL